jgi:hypothetical protein
MNNYLFANISSGKLTGRRGGGIPVFTLGEENPSQIYFLDYPKPTSYTPTSYPPLGDPFTISTNTIDKNNSQFTLRAGTAIGPAITAQSSWSNLPNTIAATYTAEYVQTSSFPVDSNGQLLSGSISISGEISLSPAPAFSSFRIRAQYTEVRVSRNNYFFTNPKFTNWVYIPYYASESDIAAALEEMYAGLIEFKVISNSRQLEIIDPPTPASSGPDAFPQQLQAKDFTLNQQRYNLEKSFGTSTNSPIMVIQSGEFSFFYQINGEAIKTTISGATDLIAFRDASNVEIDTSRLVAPYGKYANINFNNPAWDTFIGNENEKQIWLDAVLDNKVVAQGPAILRKKLSV